MLVLNRAYSHRPPADPTFIVEWSFASSSTPTHSLKYWSAVLFQIEILPPFKILEPDTQLELRPSTRICEVLCKLRRFFFCVVCQSELLFYCRPVTDGVDYCTVERIIFREIFFKFDPYSNDISL